MSFALDIKKFAQKCGANADMVVRKTVQEITTSIIEMSPVGDPSKWEGWEKGGVGANQDHWLVTTGFVGEGYVGGHFRANWQLGIGSLPTGEVEGVDPSGTETKAKAKAAIPAKAAGPVYYFGNNLPYAIPLEEGHSTQAPYGMVGLTQVRFNDFVKKAVGELK
jgi:hypothetical protein